MWRSPQPKPFYLARQGHLPTTPLVPSDKEASIFSILPTVVKSRLPRLSSLRGSTNASKPQSGSQSPSLESGLRTPDLGYASAMILSGAQDVSASEYFPDGTSSEEDLSQTGRATRMPMEINEDKSGIHWKFANQGLNLLSLVVEESSLMSEDSRFGNASFARQVYLHAITYLLRALPSDLTTEEKLGIRSALPTGMAEPLNLNIQTFSAESRSSNDKLSNSPSLLHRAMASFVVRLFILFHFLLPYFTLFMRSAYQYERTHRISERVLNQSMDTVDVLGKRGLVLTEKVYSMGDGQVGHAFSGAVLWFVEGVTGGINEGVGEGLAIMGAKRSVQEGKAHEK